LEKRNGGNRRSLKERGLLVGGRERVTRGLGGSLGGLKCFFRGKSQIQGVSKKKDINCQLRGG